MEMGLVWKGMIALTWCSVAAETQEPGEGVMRERSLDSALNNDGG